MTKILIVGGVAGGASAAARARRLDENAEIIIFERGEYVSFANCGLPYYIGGEIKDRSKLLLQTPQSFFNRFNVEVRVQHEVIKINRLQKSITIKRLVDNTIYDENYDFLLLSPGAGPFIPPINGIENPLTFTLRNISDMDRIKDRIHQYRPQHATVVGGGFIGLEMMEAFHHLNIKTSLIELSDQVMAPVDAEMAGFLHKEIRDKGIDLRLKAGLESVKYDNEQLILQLDNGDSFHTDLLIMAIGVRPDVALAEQAGLAIGNFGGIVTDAEMQTSEPDIYAVGDAVEDIDFVTGKSSFVPLAGPANRQGRMVAGNMLGHKEQYQGTQGTAICKVFELAVGTTGKNEKQLQKGGYRYEKVYLHAGSHAGYYPGAEIVSLKLLFSPDSGKILGAQAVGKKGIDKRIDVISVAQRAGMTVHELQHVELSYAPPYGNAKDIINQAAFVATNLIKGDLLPIHFNQIHQLSPEQLLVDVRTPEELKNLGYLDGAINIPVDELRERMHELPKEKEIIVYCQVGLRGNVAYRQLVNNGFKSRNLLGGYRTWLFAQEQ
ncbi:CoA-disulfide reductase [Parashewanella curva]|uniref:CoA-disulfide reductase n=1 Tax=Parashewanella curva TaxID=2338552 RepID=A0A3L8PVW7_9GAMM|nr:FAD-dependent oxidoreductase [Parashewanella curva]RLV58733.1 CoA-disulfide reductase [Parashewanella curva]